MLANVFFSLIALIVFVLAFVFALRGYRQGLNRSALAITAPNGVSVERYVAIGGIHQWISVRGEDLDNPILLVIHGGPGNALSGLTYRLQAPLERRWTIVNWDQRGAGKTFARHGKAGAGEVSIDRIVRDGIEVAEWLRREFGKDRLVLLGISWGSMIGTEMALRRPDLFSAYVGSGQVIDIRRGEAVSYAALMAQLTARSETRAAARLAAIGAPPYPSRKALLGQRRVLMANGSALDKQLMRALPSTLFFAPSLSLRDVWATLQANFFSIDALYDALMDYDIRRLGSRFEVPMIYAQGAEDIQTPTVLVREYFETLEAPKKDLVLIEGGAHMAAMTHVENLAEILEERVRPYALGLA